MRGRIFVFLGLFFVILLSLETVSACTVAPGTPLCSSHDDCDPGEYCNWFCSICAPGCRDDSECPPGTYCTGFFERECLPSCSDDCTPSGSLRCADTDTYQTCGDYDPDSCLEWGGDTNCAVGEVCESGTCVATCTPESDVEFCARLSACGDVTGIDNCGDSRTASCGNTCSAGEVCQAGQCAPGDICPPSQRIMRLFSETNSHGALWSDTHNYNVEICSPGGEAINHDCTSSLLWLYDDYNSHVSTASGNGYDVPVCLDGLECQKIDSGSCPSGTSCIVIFYSDSNSHLAACDASVPYSKKICCGAYVGGAYWADANGDRLSPASSEVWDYVKMIVEDIGLAEGALVEFTVEERTGINEWVFDSSNPLVGEVINGDAVGVWRITQTDYDLTNDHDNYYFNAQGQDSGAMSISELGSDSPMDLDILEPLCGENLTLNDVRDVKVSVSDIDDIITGQVSIDGSSYDVTNGISTFSHTFNEAGNIQIILSGNNTRGEVKQTITNIMVVNPAFKDIYIAACIDSPSDYEDIEESIVLFNATSTRAINYEVGTGITEIAGPVLGDWSALTFHWTFSDGRTHPYPQGSNPLAHLFYKSFTQAGDNWAELVVEIGV